MQQPSPVLHISTTVFLALCMKIIQVQVHQEIEDGYSAGDSSINSSVTLKVKSTFLALAGILY